MVNKKSTAASGKNVGQNTQLTWTRIQADGFLLRSNQAKNRIGGSLGKCLDFAEAKTLGTPFCEIGALLNHRGGPIDLIDRYVPQKNKNRRSDPSQGFLTAVKMF